MSSSKPRISQSNIALFIRSLVRVSWVSQVRAILQYVPDPFTVDLFRPFGAEQSSRCELYKEITQWGRVERTSVN